MEEVKIHSGTRIRLKKIQEGSLPQGFAEQLREYAQKEERIQAVFVFAVQAEDQDEQPSMAVAVKSGLFDRKDEGFLQIVEVIQLMLPEDFALNLYRFGAPEVLATYCVNNVEPLFLRSAAWLDKQKKKYGA